MSWPNHFPTSGDPLRNRVAVDSQAFAQMSKACVISACGTVDDGTIKKLKVGPGGEKFLRDPDACGGSLIVGSDSRVLAGPMGPEEGILYAECNLEVGIGMKLRHDFAGHYNRPDVFQLHVNRTAPKLYHVSEDKTETEQDPGTDENATEDLVSLEEENGTIASVSQIGGKKNKNL